MPIGVRDDLHLDRVSPAEPPAPALQALIEAGVGQRQVSVSEFAEYWQDAKESGMGPLLCQIEEELGIVKTVAEQYLP